MKPTALPSSTSGSSTAKACDSWGRSDDCFSNIPMQMIDYIRTRQVYQASYLKNKNPHARRPNDGKETRALVESR
jgi:hypothetical protein